MKVFNTIAIILLTCATLSPLQRSYAGQAPNEVEAKRFILAYRANQVPQRMFRSASMQEKLRGNTAAGNFLECLSANLSPDEFAEALIPFVVEQFSDSEVINRISAFLEAPHGKRMLDQMVAQIPGAESMVDNKVRMDSENAHISLSPSDLDAIRAFEGTPDYAAFNKFIDAIPQAFSRKEVKIVLNAVKLKCGGK